MQAHIVIKRKGNVELCGVISYGISSNVYILRDGKSALMVDSGYGPPYSNMLESLKKLNIKVDEIEKILLTHRHRDHINAVKQIIEENRDVKIYVHRGDAEVVQKKLKLDRDKLIKISNGGKIELKNITVKAIYTPGHTVGSLSYIWEDVLFSGDLVFANGMYGRTDLPTGNIIRLVESLEKINKMNFRKLLPGHGEIILRDAKMHVKAALRNARLKVKRKQIEVN